MKVEKQRHDGRRLAGTLEVSGRSVMRYLHGPKMWGAILVAGVHAAAAVTAFHAFAGPRVLTRAVERDSRVAVHATLPVIVITAHRLRDESVHRRDHAIPIAVTAERSASRFGTQTNGGVHDP